MFVSDDDVNNLNSTCAYVDVTALPHDISNSIMHLNVRSIFHKVAEIEGVLSLLGFPKALLVSETWLDLNTTISAVTNCSFISSPRLSGRGGGVGIFISNSIQYSVTVKSSDSI
jgi:hypothetical protein